VSVRTDRLLLGAVPKMGSTWLREVLLTQGRHPDALPSVHGPLHGLSEEDVGGRTLFAGLRRPLPWAASAYLHLLRRHPQSWLRPEGGRPRSFEAFLEALTGARWAPVGALEHLVDWLPPEAHAAARARGVGLWTMTLQYLLGDEDLWRTGEGHWLVHVLLNVEVLNQALEELLGEPIQAQFSRPRNTALEHGDLDPASLDPGAGRAWLKAHDGALAAELPGPGPWTVHRVG
jgi:hypothetical protein